MTGSCRWAAALVLATAMVPLVARERRAEGSENRPGPDAGVPFRLVEGFLVVVKGSIGERHDLNFVIDTGTHRTVIGERIARALGAPRSLQEMQVFGEDMVTSGTELAGLRIGPILEADLSVLTADLQPLAERFSLKLDALIGMDVLGERCLTIDYAAQRLGFVCDGVWPAQAPLDRRAPYPVVEASVNGTSYRLMVDSGSAAIVIFETAIPAGRTIEAEGEADGTHLTGTTRLTWFTPGRLGLGGFTVGTPPVFIMKGAGGMPEYDGVFGTGWLPGDKVRLDFARRVVSWQ